MRLHIWVIDIIESKVKEDWFAGYLAGIIKLGADSIENDIPPRMLAEIQSHRCSLWLYYSIH